MTSLLIIGPDWVSALSDIVVALGTVVLAVIAVLKYIVVVQQDEKREHVPLFSGFNLDFFQRSSMRTVSKKARSISKKMEKEQFFPTLIFFIGRGGAIFGSLISYNLKNKPIYCVDRKYDSDKVTTIFPIDNNIPREFLESVLIVAGEAHSGDTINYIKKQFEALNSESTIKTCVFFKQKNCNQEIDYVGWEKENSVLMPWQNADFIREQSHKHSN